MFQLWFFFFRFGDFRREFYEYAADLMKRVLTNSGMLRVCFLLQLVKRLILAFFFFSSSFLFSYARARSPSLCLSLSPPFLLTLDLSLHSFVETNTPWQQKVIRIINTSFFLLLLLFSPSLPLSLRSCMCVRQFFFFFFCHQHCLNYVAAYSMVRDNLFLVYEWMNEKTEKGEKSPNEDKYMYVCMYVCT